MKRRNNPTSLHILAPSKLTMVTLKFEEVFYTIVNVVKPANHIFCIFPLFEVCLWLILISRTVFFPIFLLILPSSGLEGFMSVQLGLFLKLGLWCLRVTNASLFAVILILSLSSSLSVLHCDMRPYPLVRFLVFSLYTFSYEIFVL